MFQCDPVQYMNSNIPLVLFVVDKAGQGNDG